MKHSTCEISLIIPTRNRRDILAETLARLEMLPDRNFEIIVCDNGSTDDTLTLQEQFSAVRWIALGENLGCAARNVAAAAARGRLFLMLDDDSWPAPHVIDHLVHVFQTRPDLGAAALRVRLADPPHRHDAGGVAGVFFNCGGAVRRRAFLDAGGFPVDFDYYVEEYDLCARLWQAGWRVEPLGEPLIWHGRDTKNRNADHMLRLLVRNNLRFWRRYAPVQLQEQLIETTIDRYQRVAVKEGALDGFRAGLDESRAILACPARRRPLTIRQFESLMGIDAAREVLHAWADKHHVKKVAAGRAERAASHCSTCFTRLRFMLRPSMTMSIAPMRGGAFLSSTSFNLDPPASTGWSSARSPAASPKTLPTTWRGVSLASLSSAPRPGSSPRSGLWPSPLNRLSRAICQFVGHRSSTARFTLFSRLTWTIHAALGTSRRQCAFPK